MKYFLSLTGIVMLLVSSCSIFEESSPEIVISVEDDIIIEMRENLGSESNGFYITLTSQDSFECAGLEYDYIVSKENFAYFFQIKGLKNPKDCSGNSHRIVSDIFMRPEHGSYIFDLAIGDEITNNGTMLVNEDRINLSFHESYGVIMPHETLLRIPDGTVWGYVSGHGSLDPILDWVNLEFQELGEEPSLTRGYYGYFEINRLDGSVKLLPEPEAESNLAFVLHLNSDESTLAGFVNQFSNYFGETAFIEMRSWTGQTYR